MTFDLIPAARKTEPQEFSATTVTLKAFPSQIIDLAIIFENDNNRLRYFISNADNDYIKTDVSEFNRVWFEFGRLDKEYNITLITE